MSVWQQKKFLGRENCISIWHPPNRDTVEKISGEKSSRTHPNKSTLIGFWVEGRTCDTARLIASSSFKLGFKSSGSTRPTSVLSPTSFIFNFSTHFSHMYHTMNDSSGTRLQLLFDTALQSYEKQTGLKLIDHPLARQLENCHTVDSVVLILQNQAPALTGFRKDGRIMRSLKRVVHVLHALSTSSTLGEGIGLVRLTQPSCSHFLMLVL